MIHDTLSALVVPIDSVHPHPSNPRRGVLPVIADSLRSNGQYRPILTRSWYMWQHEPCFFGWVRGQKPSRHSDDHPASVWVLPTVKPGSTTDHPTSKPVEVFAIPMRQHTVPGDVCYEPFSGSGSQFVAGEQLGRLVYGLELQPVYVAVILERLAGMGLEPCLEALEEAA